MGVWRFKRLDARGRFVALPEMWFHPHFTSPVNALQAVSPFGVMIAVGKAAHLTERAEIRTALSASKSIQSQVAAVSSVRSLLRLHHFVLTAWRNSPP